ncbi:alpha/beta hydrolase fold domain-containing protein [Rhodococcus hoagii]|nr:alpha/beta hydrolase fold domain-containing protein [Prescottella equi]NKZ93096.1 alpha/beta hydrolase fold domain-containing protein [Prescottella equi]
MPLTADAQRLIDGIAADMKLPMHTSSVGELRASYAARMTAPTTEIHSVRDVVVPSVAGGVPVRVYRPTDEESLPVVMWLHSGGCVFGGLDQNSEYLRKLSLAAGVVVVSVDYRLAPEHPHPAALEDCRIVWDWLVSGPPEVPADVTRAVVAGESAGGTLTFALTQQLRDSAGSLPVAQVSFYGAAEMRVSNPEQRCLIASPEDCEWFWDLYAPDPQSRLFPDVSPGLARDLTGLPPTFVVTAEVDPTRDATEAYAQRLAAAGVDVDLMRYEGVMHGFATMLEALPQARNVFDRTVAFLAPILASPRAGT